MIVVFGSLNLDLAFRTAHLPKPGETVIGGSFTESPGGKGLNQAIAAQRARRPDAAAVRFVGALGRDAFALRLQAALSQDDVDASALTTVDGASGCAGIFVDQHGENEIVVASGANLATQARQVPDDWLGPSTTLVLQMETPTDEIAALLFRARQLGARTVLNFAPARALPEAALRAATVLVVNEIEIAMLAAHLGIPSGTPEAQGRALSTRLGARVFVSLGPVGALAIGGPLAWRAGVLPIKPVDTTGAGDAFVGALAVSLDEGHALPEALRFASVAGGLTCLKEGAAPAMPTRAEIEGRLGELPEAEPI